jgi:hypothetical protein
MTFILCAPILSPSYLLINSFFFSLSPLLGNVRKVKLTRILIAYDLSALLMTHEWEKDEWRNPLNKKNFYRDKFLARYVLKNISLTSACWYARITILLKKEKEEGKQPTHSQPPQCRSRVTWADGRKTHVGTWSVWWWQISANFSNINTQQKPYLNTNKISPFPLSLSPPQPISKKWHHVCVLNWILFSDCVHAREDWIFFQSAFLTYARVCGE